MQIKEIFNPRLPRLSSNANLLMNNTIFKLLFFIVIFYLIEPVITEILIFFGIESEKVYMYMSWIMFLLLLMVFLPLKNGLIDSSTVIATEPITP
jgi:hypothetical protein